MLLRPLLFTASLTVLVFGCTANEPGPSSPEEGTQGPTTTAENSEAGYRVSLPQGSSTTPTEKSPGQYEYTTPGGTVIITVKPGDKAAYEAAKAQITAKATSFGGYGRGDDSKFSSAWREATTSPRSSATLLFEGGKIYECNVVSNSAPTLMVCQSLKAI
jgi:hypothetical protein